MVISTTPSSRASESIRLMRGRDTPSLSGDIALLLILQIIPAGYISQAGPFFFDLFSRLYLFCRKVLHMLLIAQKRPACNDKVQDGTKCLTGDFIHIMPDQARK